VAGGVGAVEADAHWGGKGWGLIDGEGEGKGREEGR
jgi:hypothetical protein